METTESLLLKFNKHPEFRRRKSTIRSYYYILRRFFSDTQMPPRMVSKKVILDYCVSKDNGDIHTRVIALKRALKQFFIFLNDEHRYRLDLRIFNDISVREKDFSPLQVLRFEDTLKIINKAKDKANTFAKRRDLLLLLMYSVTGMRKSEVIKIRISDVNLDKGLINIWHTKTNQPRCIPIPPILIESIKLYMVEREHLAKCDNLIITFAGKQVTESCITSIAKTFKDMYGIKFSFHSFRRGYASDLFLSGAEVPYISKSLGHARSSTTLDYYIYCADKAFREALSTHPAYSIDRIDFYFSCEKLSYKQIYLKYIYY